MKKFLLSLLVMSAGLTLCSEKEEEPSKLTIKDIEGHSAFWVKQIPQLEPDELALLSNYLYFESLVTTYEALARQALITIHTASIHLNRQLATNESEAKIIASNTATTLHELTTELLPARMYANKSAQACLKEIEKSDFTTLKKMVVNYQQYSRAIIAQFIKQDKPSIEAMVSNSTKSIEQQLKKMNECQITLQSILDHKNPYLKEGMDADVADLDVSLACADGCLGAMNEMTLACAAMRSMSVDLLNISTLTNKLFYQALYDKLIKKSGIEIMFDQNGLIEEDDRDEVLPGLDAKKMTVHKKHLAA